MRRRIYNKITAVIVNWWFLILVICAGLTAFSYQYTAMLFGNISTDLIKLLPHDYQSVQTLEKIRSKFMGGGSLAVVLESDNPEKTRELVHFIANEFKGDPAVKAANYKKMGYDFFDKHKLLFLDLEDLKTIRDRIDRRIQKEKLGSFYIDFEEEGEDKEFKFGDLESKYKQRYTAGARNEYITDEDGKIYTISIDSADKSESLDSFNAFYNHIRSRLDPIDIKSFDPTMKIYYAGTVRTRLDEYRTLVHDLKIAGLISGAGIFLLLALYFRRPLSVLLIFAPLASGIIFTFAFSHIFIKNLNVVTSFLFAVLGGLGIEVGIHMFARYIEERSNGKNISESVFIILFHTGRSAITAGLTVAATFLVLIVNDFKGFSEFGFITGAGIIIVYATYHILFPPILIAAEKLKLLKFKQTPEQHVKDSAFPHSRTVLGVTAAIFCLSAVGLSFTQFEYNFGKLKANIAGSRLAREKLRKTTASVNRPASVLIKNLDEAIAVKEFVRKKIEEDETAKRPAVLDVYKSWHDIVQYEQDEKMAVIGEIKKLLSDQTIKLVKGEHKKDLDRFKEILNETVPIKESEIPGRVKDIFFGTANADDGLQISYINAEPHLELDDGKNAIAFAERVEKMETNKGTFYASSDAIVFADVLRTMLKDVPRVIFLSFGMVLLFVFLDFRNFRKMAIVVSPIILGVVITFGFMFLFRMKLNFYNMIVIPTVFGTSIDNSIHIYHRYEEMGKSSLMKVVKTSGGAALMSSLTNILGFLGLVFANHLGLASIGKLAIVGMSACLFTTLVYFPALLERMERGKLVGGLRFLI
jgi:predicted RND superfamily exporter protein